MTRIRYRTPRQHKKERWGLTTISEKSFLATRMNLRAPCTYMHCICPVSLHNRWITDVATSCALYPLFRVLGAKIKRVFSVASHVGNPCGHTFCGPCGWKWHAKNVSWLANFGTIIVTEQIEKKWLSMLPKNATYSIAYDTQYCYGQYGRKTCGSSCFKRR